MNLQSAPFNIDFLGNNPTFTIRTSPNRVEERRLRRVYKVNSLTAGNLTVETPHGNLRWAIKQAASIQKPYEMRAGTICDEVLLQLDKKMVLNAELNRHYTLAADIDENETAVLTVEAKEGLDGDYFRMTSETDADITENASRAQEGKTEVKKKDHRIIVRLETEHGSSPELYYSPHGNTVKVGTKPMEALLPEQTVPSGRANIGTPETVEIGCRLRMVYREEYDSEDSLTKATGQYMLLNATVHPDDRNNNTGDWKACDTNKLWRKTDIDIYGQDNNATVRTDTETEQYLYVSNLTASPLTRSITVAATGTEGTATTTIQATFPAMSICRVSCGWTATGITGIGTPLHYSVTIDRTGTDIQRNYTIVPRPWDAVTLLLHTRYGTYESMIFRSIKKEIRTEGDETTTSQGTGYLIRKKRKVITLRTGAVTAREMKKASEALQDGRAYLIENTHAHRLSLAYGSYTVADTDEDMLETEIEAVMLERKDRAAHEISTLDDYITERETTIKASAS